MREIVLDTETTGLDPSSGHRIIEIGCLELHNYLPTGRTYHQYINPQRDIPTEAFQIHGISEDFVKDKPTFPEIVDAFLEFIAEAPLVIHNASFDMRFINYELANLKYPKIKMSRTIDTLQMARQRFPGSPANLDALYRRFKVDNSNRTKHGALLDSELLAEVYLELMGGRQRHLTLVQDTQGQLTSQEKIARPFREPRTFKPNDEELALHQELLGKIE